MSGAARPLDVYIICITDIAVQNIKPFTKFKSFSTVVAVTAVSNA